MPYDIIKSNTKLKRNKTENKKIKLQVVELICMTYSGSRERQACEFRFPLLPKH